MIPKRKDDLAAGQRFGRLTVLLRHDGHRKAMYYECLCDCGNTRRVRGYDLVRGRSKSCGCLNRELIATIAKLGHNRRHGQTGAPEYTAWRNLRARCDNLSYPSFKHYGGRGITYCDRWRTFENFLADM